MIWRTNKPTEKVIVAKLTEDFCHLKNRYAILRLVNEPYQHYSEDGEEIPYAAIEKWASLEEESDKSLDEAATKFAYSEGYQDPEYYNIVDAFKTGAKWQEKRDEETIKTAEDHAFLAGADWQKEQIMKEAVEGIARPDDCEIWVNLVGHSYKFNDGDKVHIIVLPKEEKK